MERRRLLGADEELTIPDLLGDFHVRVGRFFGIEASSAANHYDRVKRHPL